MVPKFVIDNLQEEPLPGLRGTELLVLLVLLLWEELDSVPSSNMPDNMLSSRACFIQRCSDRQTNDFLATIKSYNYILYLIYLGTHSDLLA